MELNARQQIISSIRGYFLTRTIATLAKQNFFKKNLNKKYYPHAHCGILVDKIEDLPMEKGEVVKHRDGTIGVYVKDPFGNYLEYIWYSDDQKEVFLNND